MTNNQTRPSELCNEAGLGYCATKTLRVQSKNFSIKNCADPYEPCLLLQLPH